MAGHLRTQPGQVGEDSTSDKENRPPSTLPPLPQSERQGRRCRGASRASTIVPVGQPGRSAPPNPTHTVALAAATRSGEGAGGHPLLSQAVGELSFNPYKNFIP